MLPRLVALSLASSLASLLGGPVARAEEPAAPSTSSADPAPADASGTSDEASAAAIRDAWNVPPEPPAPVAPAPSPLPVPPPATPSASSSDSDQQEASHTLAGAPALLRLDVDPMGKVEPG